jgi:hypothetical protein
MGTKLRVSKVAICSFSVFLVHVVGYLIKLFPSKSDGLLCFNVLLITSETTGHGIVSLRVAIAA